MELPHPRYVSFHTFPRESNIFCELILVKYQRLLCANYHIRELYQWVIPTYHEAPTPERGVGQTVLPVPYKVLQNPVHKSVFTLQPLHVCTVNYYRCKCIMCLNFLPQLYVFSPATQFATGNTESMVAFQLCSSFFLCSLSVMVWN